MKLCYFSVVFSDGIDLVPNTNEIVICNLDRKGNSTMTWSYPCPRVVSHLSSTPVPFNTDEIMADGHTVTFILSSSNLDVVKSNYVINKLKTFLC